MTCDIAVDRLEPHPANANVMSEGSMDKLRRHIARSGRYEPLVVRPLDGAADGPRYQVLNGHHRLAVLRQLGHERVRCEVWEVDDREALLLLATLNRLEGRDDPLRRATLLARLSEGATEPDLTKLARLLPEDRAALDRALALAREPLPLPVPPGESPAAFKPMTFFLTSAEHETVGRALRAAGGAARGEPGASPRGGSRAADAERGRSRAAALVALAEGFLAPSAAADRPGGLAHDD